MMLWAALIACGGDDGNDPVPDNSQPDIDTEQSDADTAPVWVTDKTYAGLEWSPLSENKAQGGAGPQHSRYSDDS